MNPSFTILYGGTEQTLAGWGIRADVAWRFVNKERDVLSLNTIEPFDPSVAQFQWGGTITLYAGRVLGTGGFSGGTVVFQGTVGLLRTSASGGRQAAGYEVYGPWYLLERLQFKQTRKVFAGWVDGPGTPASGAVLTAVVTAETFLGEDPAQAYWTGAQTISEILDWANECWNPTKRGATTGRDNSLDILQIGAVDCGQVFPKSRANTVSCAEAILQVLRYFPATVGWFDHTTTPPTLHLRDLANLAGVSETISANQEREIALAPQNERQLAGVMLVYKTVNLTDGVPWPAIYKDVYPPTVTDYTPNVLSHVIDLPGWKVNAMQGNVQVTSLAGALSADAATRAGFWSGLDRTLQDPLIKPSTITCGAPLAILDDHGNPVDPAAFPNILMPGSQVSAWMPGVNWVQATIQVQEGFTKYHDGGTFLVGPTTVVNRLASYKVILTNASSGVYTGSQLADTGEAVPPCYPAAGSLAQAAYTSASVLQYEGRVTFIDASLRGGIGVGNVLSLTGPNHTFPNCLIQEVECRPHFGETRVVFGPAARVDAGLLVELWRASRWRTTVNMPTGRGTGQGTFETSIDQSGAGSKESTAHGLGTAPVQSHSYDQGTATGGGANGITVIQHSAEAETISLARVSASTGSPISVDGAGNPIGSVTLALGATGGKAVALQTMPNGSRVLASSDFAAGGTAPWLFLGFVSPNAMPDASGCVVLKVVPWNEGWSPVAGQPNYVNPASLTPAYAAMPRKLRSNLAAENVPGLTGTGTEGAVSYSAYTFTSFTGGGAVYWNQYRAATGPSGSGLPAETQAVTPPYLVNDILRCEAAATGVNVQIAAGDPVTAATVVSAGAGYQVNDVLTINGGTGTAAELEVIAVSGSGAITQAVVAGAGSYSTPPANPATATGGHGSGGTFALIYTAVGLLDANYDRRGWGEV